VWVTSVDGDFGGIAGPQKLVLKGQVCEPDLGSIRQAMAETSNGALCPITSLAPVLAITGMVAGTLNSESFDPVGEIRKPFVTGPNRIPISTKESTDANRQEGNK
jgi:hypothetical protein